MVLSRSDRMLRRWAERNLSRRQAMTLGGGLAAAVLGESAPETGAQDTSRSAATPVAAERDWLFTVSFQRGTLAPSASGAGSATLTLAGITPDILAFTDRPERLAALVQAQTFVDILQAVQNDPPNAALVGRQSTSEQPEPLVVELRSATCDETARTMTFDVQMMPGVSLATPAELSFPTITLQDGYLFIDDVQLPPKIPVNVCGNSVGVIGLLEPAFGNTCIDAG